MSRFRYSGTNWEGRPWRASSAVEALGRQIEEAWPDRHGADGTVASRGHDQNSPRSDHRPRPTTGPGIVRAIDVGETVEDQGETLAEELRRARDPRLKYLIHEGRLFSSYDHSNGPAWSWRRYSGYNAHLNHVHVSVYGWADQAGQDWNIDLGGGMAALQVIDVQKALNKADVTDYEGKTLAEDDIYGARTESALVKAFRSGVNVVGLRVTGTFSGEVSG